MRTAIGIAVMAILLGFVAACSSSNNNKTGTANDDTQIRNRVNSIINHFNGGDAKAILDDDVPASARRTCSDKDAKETVNGARQQLQDQGGKLAVKSVDSINVLGNKATADVVFTTGVAAVPETPPVPVSFVKDGGTWHFDPGDVSGCNGLIPTGVG